MKKYIVSIVLLLWEVLVFADAYQAYRLYDLNCPVEKVAIKTEDPFFTLSKKVNFSENGMQQMASWVYDENGLPLGDGFCEGSTFWNTNIKYDSSDKPIALSKVMNGDKKYPLIHIDIIYSYNKVGEVIRKEVIYKESHTKYVFVYSDYQYDDKENWISRNVKQSEENTNGLANDKSYTETRRIEYR